MNFCWIQSLVFLRSEIHLFFFLMFLWSSFTIKVSPGCGKTRDRQGTDGAGLPGPREPFGVTAIGF